MYPDDHGGYTAESDVSCSTYSASVRPPRCRRANSVLLRTHTFVCVRSLTSKKLVPDRCTSNFITRRKSTKRNLKVWHSGCGRKISTLFQFSNAQVILSAQITCPSCFARNLKVASFLGLRAVQMCDALCRRRTALCTSRTRDNSCDENKANYELVPEVS